MESNLPTPSSQNLKILSNEQKTLLDFVQNQSEYDIAMCVEQSKQIQHLENPESELVELVAKWRMFIGIPKNDISEELAIVASFILHNYSFLTIKEIELAINLSITRKLKDVEFVGYFSPLYVGKVLDSYLYYRKITMSDSIRRLEKHRQQLLEEKNKPTPEMRMESCKILFKTFYEEWKEKGEISDVFNYAYNFLRQHKFLKLTQAEIDEAQAYGKKKFSDMKSKEPLLSKFDMDRDLAEKRFARNWCVQKFFEKNDFVIFLNNIDIKMFP